MRPLYYTFFILLLLTPRVSAQEAHIYSGDDLHQDMLRLNKGLPKGDWTLSSESAVKKALREKVYTGVGWHDSIAKYCILENFYYAKNDRVSCIRSHLHILTYYKQHLSDHDFGIRLVKVGEGYFGLQNYSLAQEFFNEALEHEIDDVESYVHSQIGMAHMYMNELDESIASYSRAAELARNELDAISHRNSLGYVYFLSKKYQQSLKSYQNALRLYAKYHQKVDSIQYFILMSNMSSLHFELGKREEGYAYLDTIFASDYYKVHDWLVNEIGKKYAFACMDDGDCDKARVYLNIMKQTLDDYPDIKLEINYLNTEQRWQNLCGTSQEALRVTRELLSLQDSMERNRMNQLSAVELIQRSLYEDQLGLVERNLSLTQNNQHILAESNYRLKVLFIISGAVAVLAIISLYLYLGARRRRQKRKEEYLRLQQRYLEEQKKTTELNFRMEQQEIERRRLELVQMLSNFDLNNSLYEELQAKIAQLKSKAGDEIKEDLNLLHQFIHSHNKSNLIDELMDKNPDLLAGDFKTRLEERFPQLSASELQLVLFIRLGLSSKEMAQLKNVEPASIRIFKHRVKLKMGLSKETDLDQFIGEI